jgi:hypothetical protein
MDELKRWKHPNTEAVTAADETYFCIFPGNEGGPLTTGYLNRRLSRRISDRRLLFFANA